MNIQDWQASKGIAHKRVRLLVAESYEHTTTLFQDLQLRQGRSWEVAEAMAMP
ncbi:hypothetical protein AK812_SmicGene46505, partial [Symbiodinium microadriaticum]